jgi:peptide/nickel transport system ATP-binding protein
MGTTPFVSVSGLNVDLAVPGGCLHAVRDATFQIDAGQTLCIVGESGSGKSMTALGLMGLLPSNALRQARELRVGHHDLLALNRRAMADLMGSELAMIFQEPMTSLNPCFTVGNQMAEIVQRHRGATRRAALAQAREWLERVGIPPSAGRLDQYPHQLSGGLRQRVMIAMMLMCGPRLIIADEPTTALDVTIQAQILQLLAGLQRELGITMIFITHDLGVVSRIADKVAVMYAGQIVEMGPARDVLLQPHHPYTKGLLHCVPVPGRTQAGAHLGTIPGTVPALTGTLTGCSFAGRCAHVHDRCTSITPPLAVAAAAHDQHRQVRCLFTPDQMWGRQ